MYFKVLLYYLRSNSLCYILSFVIKWVASLHLKLRSINSKFNFKEGCFPYSWEDINPEINFSQMLHSAGIYQLPLTNGLCCIQTTHTVKKLHW